MMHNFPSHARARRHFAGRCRPARNALRTARHLAAVGWLVAAGCGAVDQDLQARIAAEAAGLAPRADDDAAVVRASAAASSGELPSADAFPLPADAGLATYIDLALRRNPEIARAIRSLQAAGYRVPQVTSLEDPMIELLPPTGNMVETAAGMMDGAIGISQVIPFPGRLGARGRVAEHTVRMAFASLTDVRVATTARVARHYYDYYVAGVALETTRANDALLRQVREVAAARYRSGMVAQQDVLRAEIEILALADEAITLEQQQATARAALNALIDRAVDAPLPPPHDLDLDSVDWQLNDAIDRAARTSPELARLRERILRNLEAIRLARLDYFPDLRVGFNYTFIGSGVSPVASGKDNWSLPLGLTLPIWWQRLRAGVLEANAASLSAVEQYESARNTIALGVHDTLVGIDSEYRRAVLYRDFLLPRTRQSLEASAAGYRTGSLDFGELLDDWRAVLNYDLAYHRALAGLEQKFADLQQLVGVPLPRHPESAATTTPTSSPPPLRRRPRRIRSRES